ncbi:MAG: beta-phosphoglucomutase [Clostridiales bacterium]|uniref:beta-phosphoglucomutase n=1 Tax=Hungatella TaxID=1649459 RepID=UPI001106E30C|nr:MULTISPECIES: beta-phosphoglucomutase [Hungatella]MCD7997011.1 beta-phosphoglucomutase [Clostridiales bacterium]MCI7380058.1 beta-phosphoglucomutase [Hungatella sp.]MDY6237292.1 beta-phosphoglucomutase [Hungatella hathewayi]
MWPQAVIFDLDGVLTDTAACHYEAWKQMAQRENLYFDRAMNQQLKGVSRMHSLEIILRENGREGTYPPDKMAFLAGWKNEAYQRLLKDLTRRDILPGIAAFLDQLQNAGIKMAVASASENADTVLERLEIRNRFDYVARAKEIKRGKPDPEIFLTCAGHLGILPKQCVGIEDAQAGIEAIKAGRMFAVGIGVEVRTVRPDLELTSTAELTLERIVRGGRDE